MALDPQFAAFPRLGAVTASTANTARDGTGTLATVLTAGSNGTRVRRLAVIALGTTTAGMVRIYLHDGTTAHLFLEVPVTAITPSGSVQAFSFGATELTNPELLPLTIPAGWSIRVAPHNAESFKVLAGGGDL